MKFLFITFLFLSTSSTVLALEIPPSFKKYITQNSIYIEALNKKMDRIFKHTFPLCEDTIKITRLKPSILSTPRINREHDTSTQHPDQGQWIESATVNGCKEKVKLNILSTAYKHDGIPLVYPLINGNTKIEPLYQSDAAKEINTVLTTSKNCRSNKITINTIFYGYRSPHSQKLSSDNQNIGWLEQWKVHACGKTESVNLAVLPDPKTKYKYIAKVKP